MSRCAMSRCAMSRCAMRRSAVRRCAMRRSAVLRSTVRSAMAAIVIAASKMAMLGLIAGSSVVAAPAVVMEAIRAPAVGITPAGPGAYTQKDAAVEVRRPIKAHGSAGVGRGFIVAVRANGWNADFDGNLRASRWRQSQSRKQCHRAE